MIDPVILPPAVRPGQRAIGVAAISGAVDAGRLDRGIRALEALGFRVVEASNLRTRQGLFAGSDAERLAGLHRLVADPEVGAIVFARGGWGAPRLLGAVDWDLLAAHPKAYVGYSDLTPFLLAITARLGLATFHGPMVAADLARGLGARERESFLGALAGELPRRLPVAAAELSASPAEGPLLGGCLSLLASSLGTPWAADLEHAVLFLEDLNEPPYRFDRMLTHLRLSDTLNSIQGLIVGHLRAEDGIERSAFDGEVTLGGLLQDLAADHPWPLAVGLEAGHASPNLTLPIGLFARLDPSSRQLTVGLPWPDASAVS